MQVIQNRKENFFTEDKGIPPDAEFTVKETTNRDKYIRNRVTFKTALKYSLLKGRDQ